MTSVFHRALSRISLIFLALFWLSGCASIMESLEKDCTCAEMPAAPEPDMAAPAAKPIPLPVPKKAIAAYDVRKPEPTTTLPDGRLVVGGVEKVRLVEFDAVLKARIDSGANTSSLDARNMVEFERDGDKWIRFNLRANGDDPVTIERPIEKYVKVSQTNSPKPDRRPVIFLQLQLGPQTEIIEFNLTDRADMTYPVLLGRRYLLDRAVIDISQNFIQDLK